MQRRRTFIFSPSLPKRMPRGVKTKSRQPGRGQRRKAEEAPVTARTAQRSSSSKKTRQASRDTSAARSKRKATASTKGKAATSKRGKTTARSKHARSASRGDEAAVPGAAARKGPQENAVGNPRGQGAPEETRPADEALRRRLQYPVNRQLNAWDKLRETCNDENSSDEARRDAVDDYLNARSTFLRWKRRSHLSEDEKRRRSELMQHALNRLLSSERHA